MQDDPHGSSPELCAVLKSLEEEEHWLQWLEKRTAHLERRTKLVHKLVWGIICGGALGGMCGLAAGNIRLGIVLGVILGCATGRLWHDVDYWRR